MTDVWPRRLFVCAGVVVAHSNTKRLLVELYALDELEQPITNNPMVWDHSRLMKALKIGAIYSIEAQDTSDGGLQVRPRTAEFIRTYDNPNIVAGWRLRDDAARIAVRLRKDETKLTARSEHLDTLFKDLRKEYRKLDLLGRRAFEMAVIAALRQERLL